MRSRREILDDIDRLEKSLYHLEDELSKCDTCMCGGHRLGIHWDERTKDGWLHSKEGCQQPSERMAKMADDVDPPDELDSRGRTQIAYLVNAIVTQPDRANRWLQITREEAASEKVIAVVDELQDLVLSGKLKSRIDIRALADDFVMRRGPMFYVGMAMLGSLENWRFSQE